MQTSPTPAGKRRGEGGSKSSDPLIFCHFKIDSHAQQVMAQPEKHSQNTRDASHTECEEEALAPGDVVHFMQP